MGVESVDGVADSLIVAAEGGRNLAGMLPPRTGEQDLAAPQDHGIGRPYARLESVRFGIGQSSDKNRRSHA